SARSTAPGTVSWSETRRPDVATTCAMPPPIWPAPTIRTCSKRTRGVSRLRPGCAREIGAGSLAQPEQGPQENERKDDDPDHDLDRCAARLAARCDEETGIDDAAGSREPAPAGPPREEQSH